MVAYNLLPDIYSEEEKQKKSERKLKKQYRKNKYFIQTNTTNKSFLAMYVILGSLGIENKSFHLALYDETLFNVDPYDPNLTTDQKARIFNECRKNIWYFIREVVRIPVSGNEKGKPYGLHRGNLACTWCLINNINFFLEMPRQNGKSIAIDVILLWLYNFGTTNTSMLIMNKAHDDAKENLDRIKEMRDVLPAYLRLNTKKLATGERSVVKEKREIVKHQKTKNTLVTKPSATSLEAADKLGRGMTQAIQWYDEFGFIKFNMTIYESASPAFSQASIEASDNNKPFCKMISTTPGDMSTDTGKDAYAFRNKSYLFSEALYNENGLSAKAKVDANSENGFTLISFQYNQLGREKDYLANMSRELGGNKLKIRREVLLEWLVLNEASPFNKQDLEELTAMNKDKKPIKQFFIDNIYAIDMYREILVNRKYIIACDVASGVSGDFSTIVIIDTKTKECIGEFKNSRIDTMDFSKVIHTVASQIIPESVVIVERNNAGCSVIDNLRRTSIASQLYYEDTSTLLQDKFKKGKNVINPTNTHNYGFWTDATKREQMFELLRKYVENYKNKLMPLELCNQILGLIYDKHGRVDHPADGHDDIVMAWNIGMWCLYFSTTITNFGITKTPDIDPATGLSEDEFEEAIAKAEADRSRRLDRLFGRINGVEEVQETKSINQFYEEADRERRMAMDRLEKAEQGNNSVSFDQFNNVGNSANRLNSSVGFDDIYGSSDTGGSYDYLDSLTNQY